VIAGRRPQLHGERGPVHVRELVRVELRNQPQLLPFLEDEARLLPVEGVEFQEHVVEAGDALFGRAGEHLLHHEPHVFRLPAPVVVGDEVRAQEGVLHYLGRAGRDARRGLQHLQLALRLERVAALGLQRRGAVGEHPHRPLEPGALELLQRRVAGAAHGGVYPSARRGYVGVAAALQHLRELAAAVAEPYQVGVAVHEAGNDVPARGVQNLGAGTDAEARRLQAVLRPDVGDSAVLHPHRRPADRAGVEHFSTPAGDRPPHGVDGSGVQYRDVEFRAHSLDSRIISKS